MISICVLHYNNNKLTNRCIDNVLLQDITDDYEVMVLDNGSALPFKNDKVRVVRLEKNTGNIGGQNACFEHAKYNAVLFVSNDVFLMRGCVKELLAFADQHPFYGQVQPKVLSSNWSIDNVGMDWVWPGLGKSRRVFKSKNVPIVPSIVYLMRKSVWEMIGGFDEALGSSHEDVDMGIRMNREYWQYSNYCCFSARAVHMGNATLSKTLENHSEVFKRARERILRKHYSGADLATRLGMLKLLLALKGKK